MNKIKLVLLVVVLLVADVLLTSIFFRGSGSPYDTGDSCNIKDYKTVEIGIQTWMAENLNCYVSDSKCYGDNPNNCKKYGRLYNWSMAMALDSSCSRISCIRRINAPHRGICPEGWHIPTNAEWDALYRFVDGTRGVSSLYESPMAGRHLKATEGWLNCGLSSSGKGYLCEDSFGFSALPSGIGDIDGYFSTGSYGFWWSASEYGNLDAYGRGMTYNSDYAGLLTRGKNYLFSVRCLQDYKLNSLNPP
jgi:uncharacterized protein (TIGR02145 family)